MRLIQLGFLILVLNSSIQTFAQAHGESVAPVFLIPSSLNTLAVAKNRTNPSNSKGCQEDLNTEFTSGSRPDQDSYQSCFRAEGQKLFKAILDWYQQEPERLSQQLEIIAHGTGGLYALQAATLAGSHFLEMPQWTLHLVSVPLDGLETATLLNNNSPVLRQLEKLSMAQGQPLNLNEFSSLSPQNVRRFLETLRLPENLTIHSYFSGNDRETSLPNDPFLEVLQFLNQGHHDGFITKASALSVPELITQTGKSFAHFHSHPENFLKFNHTDLFLKANRFLLYDKTDSAMASPQEKNWRDLNLRLVR